MERRSRSARPDNSQNRVSSRENGKAIPMRATPEEALRIKKAFEEFREAIRIDVETGRYNPPPILEVNWNDAFPHLPR